MSRRLKIDLAFNYASLGVLAASGLVMNLLVARLAGEAALGVFNQAFAIYVAASQLAVGGVHISVLRSVAQTTPESAEQSAVIASGVALSLGLGCGSARSCGSREVSGPGPWTARPSAIRSPSSRRHSFSLR